MLRFRFLFLLPCLVLGCARSTVATDPSVGIEDGTLATEAIVASTELLDGGLPAGDAHLAVNGVRGGGETAGSTDVYSLDYEAHSWLILSWGGTAMMDGPGVDLVVFENPFEVAPGNRFMDLVIVEVSFDGEQWIAFPHDYVAANEWEYSSDPEAWLGFAGKTPVLYNQDENPVDPFDSEAAGGDAFDLADLPVNDPTAETVRAEGFRYVRLVAAPSRINTDTSEPFVHAAVSDGPDIDGVLARYPEGL